MLEIVPRARRAVGSLQFPSDLRHGLDVIGDLTDTEVIAALAGLVQVLAERATQLQEPVVVAANLDQRSMPVLDLVENAHKRDLELSQVYGERPGLYLHGGIVAVVPAAGRMPRFTQDFSISLFPGSGERVPGSTDLKPGHPELLADSETAELPMCANRFDGRSAGREDAWPW